MKNFRLTLGLMSNFTVIANMIMVFIDYHITIDPMVFAIASSAGVVIGCIALLLSINVFARTTLIEWDEYDYNTEVPILFIELSGVFFGFIISILNMIRFIL